MEVLEDAGAPNLHLTSLSPSALAEQIDQEQAGLGIYHGAVLVMRIYDFFFLSFSPFGIQATPMMCCLIAGGSL